MFSGLVYYPSLWLVAAVNGLAENRAFMGHPLVRVARTTGWTPAIIMVALLFATICRSQNGPIPVLPGAPRE